MNCWTTIEQLSAQICGFISDSEEKTIKYKIQVSHGDQFSWIIQRRYSDFYALHKKITESNGIPLDMALPPKRIYGNKEPDFIEKRRQQLDNYLTSILIFFKQNPPEELVKFLELYDYEIMFLLRKMAIDIFENGDSLLSAATATTFSPYQIFAINERMKMAVPSLADSVDKRQDFSHIVDFCTCVTNLDIIGSNIPIGTSTLIPNEFPFSLQPLKSIKHLKLKLVNVNRISEIGSVRTTVEALLAQNCDLKSSNELLLADNLYKSAAETGSSQCVWTKLEILNLSNNCMLGLDDIGILVPNLRILDLSFNKLNCLFNLTGCPYLECVSYAGNCLSSSNLPANMQLLFGQICKLDFSSNQLTELSPFNCLYSLIELNLSCNLISDVEEIRHLGPLPCLEILCLTGNPVASSIDFRVRTFTFFNKRASELTLDNEKPSTIELDQISILQAIQMARATKIG